MYRWHTWLVFGVVFLAGAFIAAKYPTLNLFQKVAVKAGVG
jgi:hypothetical protein